MSGQTEIVFDKEKYEGLKSAYKTATELQMPVFNFRGHEMLTSYAKYLLEYLKPKFE